MDRWKTCTFLKKGAQKLWRKLKMILDAKSQDEFLEQFNSFLDSETSKNTKGIVYIWQTTKPIGRVKGTSPIIYIGQTINTFRSRYKNSNSIKIETNYFERYYKHMIEMYGAIHIEIKQTDNPKRTEWEELMQYNKEHKEYPPLNRSIPNEPKALSEIED